MKNEQPTEVKRYDAKIVGVSDYAGMVPAPNGEWVKYAAWKSERQRADKLEQALRTTQTAMRHLYGLSLRPDYGSELKEIIDHNDKLLTE